MAIDLRRLHVQQETGDHRLRPLQVALRQADAKDRAADARARRTIARSVWAEGRSQDEVFVRVDALAFVHQQPVVLAQRHRNHSNARGAGPLLTLPWSSNTLPWHGQW